MLLISLKEKIHWLLTIVPLFVFFLRKKKKYKMIERLAELFEPQVILSSEESFHALPSSKSPNQPNLLRYSLSPFSICNGHLHHFLSPPAPAPAPRPPLSVWTSFCHFWSIVRDMESYASQRHVSYRLVLYFLFFSLIFWVNCWTDI